MKLRFMPQNSVRLWQMAILLLFSLLNLKVGVASEEADFKKEEGFFKDEIRFQLLSKEREESKQHKNIIVFVHGQSEFAERYQYITKAIKGVDSDYLFFDLRGHGRSAGAFKSPTEGSHIDSFDQYVNDLEGLVKMLKNEKKYQNVFIISHSTGGLVTTLFLEKNPDLVKAAVLSSPMLMINTGSIPIGIAKIYAAVECLIGRDKCNVAKNKSIKDYASEEEYIRSVQTFDPVKGQNSHDVDFYRECNQGHETLIGGQPTFGWVNAGFKGVDKAFKNLKKIKTPLLIYGAGKDKFVRTDYTKDFVKKLKKARPDAQVKFQFFANDFHEILTEKDRAVAIQGIQEFLQSHL